MTPAYATVLGLVIFSTAVAAQKIDGFFVKTISMVIANFQVKDKLDKNWFFQKSFLLANISMERVFKMRFLIFGNTNILFADQELIWRTYIIKKALPTTWLIEFIDKKNFASSALNANIKAFVVHLAFFTLKITSYLVQKAKTALLLIKKITILEEYLGFADVSSNESAQVLSEWTGINE